MCVCIMSLQSMNSLSPEGVHCTNDLPIFIVCILFVCEGDSRFSVLNTRLKSGNFTIFKQKHNRVPILATQMILSVHRHIEKMYESQTYKPL